MVPRYPFHVMIYWVAKLPVKVISFDTLASAMACYQENIGRQIVAKIDIGMTIHSATRPKSITWKDVR